jgi:sugar lactone lactonase YvrE
MFKRILLGGLVLVLIAAGLPVLAQGGGGTDYSGSVPAVPFPDGLEWINVPGPLTWDMLRGKVVLLDFWTYGCINCIHIIPDLKLLEASYPDELVVIGVHSAKFQNEGNTDNIRQIVQRYGITHPVVNDSDFQVWQAWGIQAWPTVMLIDPEGVVYGYHAGEGVFPVLAPTIAGMMHQFREAGLMNTTPLEITPVIDTQPETLLAFPGKVLGDPDGGRLFIADSNHNRIVVADLDTYEVLDVIGGIDSGDNDGSYAVARFNKPQGMALSADGNTLYVTDTENHLLRAVDLVAQTVTTLAGTGYQAEYGATGGVGTAASLNSPWDVVRVENVLYMAMAGSHQLWSYDLDSGEVRVHSGSGREGIVDAAHGQAQLAQPSGISTDGTTLYFADSEASAIRESDVDPAGSVHTIVGTGLFNFGDMDGAGDAVRLQHPLGVVYVDGELYVADTYNSKIKMIDPATREAQSLTGDPAGGYVDGALDEARFDEPGGISYADGRLYVADTNNHAIRVIDLTAGTVSTVQFPNPEALQADREQVVVAAPFTGNEVTLDVQTIAPGEGSASLDVHIPEGYELNDIAESLIEWHPDGETVQAGDGASLTQVLEESDQASNLPVRLSAGQGEISADLTLYYCEAVNKSLCFVDRVRLQLPVQVEQGGEAQLSLDYEVIPPVLDTGS